VRPPVITPHAKFRGAGQRQEAASSMPALLGLRWRREIALNCEFSVVKIWFLWKNFYHNLDKKRFLDPAPDSSITQPAGEGLQERGLC